MQRKIVVALRDDLAAWQRCNVTAFVASGIGPAFPELVGRDVVDADGVTYLPKLRLPVHVLVGDAAGLRRAFDRALARGLAVSVYTDELFGTGNDEDNRAAVAAVATAELSLTGFAVVGEARQVDRAVDKLARHP